MVVYRQNNNIFYVNFKGGYSTFEKMREYGIVKYHYGDINNKTIYFICRDPYKRLESFYRDKMIKNVGNLGQLCQQGLLKYFSRKDLINKRVTFPQFLKALEDGYTDDHIAPQSRIMICEPHYRVRIERGLWELTPILGANPDDFISNVCKDTNVVIEWTAEMRNIVNKLYAEDFIKLGYSML